MKTGHELISRIDPKSNTFSITIPIVTSDKGEKLGKSAGNAVWIDENLMSSFEFYQFFVNTSDQMVETYLKIFTFLSLSEINDLMNKHKVNHLFFAIPWNYLIISKQKGKTPIIFSSKEISFWVN